MMGKVSAGPISTKAISKIANNLCGGRILNNFGSTYLLCDVFNYKNKNENVIHKSKDLRLSQMSYAEGGVEDVKMVVYIAQHAGHQRYDIADNPLATSQA